MRKLITILYILLTGFTLVNVWIWSGWTDERKQIGIALEWMKASQEELITEQGNLRKSIQEAGYSVKALEQQQANINGNLMTLDSQVLDMVKRYNDSMEK